MARDIAEVAVNVPLDRAFHYRVPDDLRERLEEGHRVLVPFGRRTTTGVCVGFPATTEVAELKPIKSLLHPDCRFDDHLLKLTRWIADYYRAGWGEVLEAALPPPIRSGKKERQVVLIKAARPAPETLARAAAVGRRAPAQARILGYLATHPGPHPRSDLLREAAADGAALKRLATGGWIEEDRVVERRSPYVEAVFPGPRVEPELNEDQSRAGAAIAAALEKRTFQPLLLHGVTGSGKTEVYIRALRQVIARGGRGLVLLPEISLTPQTVTRFQQGLPPDAAVAVVHSMLSPAERTSAWRSIQEGRAKLVIGARSSVFSPIADLEIIVVDEEHDSSYKQESSPRYNARDVAVVRARLLGVPIILGSATPSLESYHNAVTGKYQLLELPRRATQYDLPVTSVVTLGPEFYRADGQGLISPQLDHLIRRTLRDREQALIYLNRRGFSTYLHCVRCGFVLKCDQCDVTLTFHRRQNCARCHYCGRGIDVPLECPDCRMPGPRKSGVGTEKVVAELSRRYEGVRIARLDRDSVTTHRGLLDTVARFARGEFDILVGTQMAAKGHDFPRVSLVGILSADTGLNFPDFRAAERTFQLVTQVSGRAGRGKRPGRVLAQTFFPDHYAIRYAVAGDYKGFFHKEAAFRKALGYPPFGRLVKIQITSSAEEKLEAESARLGSALRDRRPPEVTILGPAPSPIARIQGKFRGQMLLKSSASRPLHDFLAAAGNELKGGSRADVSVDVDPQTLL